MTTPVDTQPERTALAWQRTGLGVLAVAALLGHRAVTDGRAVLLVLAGSGALLGLAVLGVLAPARYRDIRRRTAAAAGAAAPRPVACGTAIVLATGATAAVAGVPPG